MGQARGRPGGDRGAASSWDAAYQDGRYRADPPEPFVADIIDAYDMAEGRAGHTK